MHFCKIAHVGRFNELLPEAFEPKNRTEYSITMLFPFSMPRLPALLAGLLIGTASLQAFAADIADIQRLLKQAQYPQALDEADAYISTKPKDPQGRFLKGVILSEMNRNNEAVAVFTKLTEEFPELPEPYNNLAVLYAQQKQYDKARTALEMAIRTHPSYATAHENLGDLYAKLASQAYDKALQIDSSNSVAQTKLSLIRELIGKSSRPTAKGTNPAKVVETAKAAPPVAPPPVPAVAAKPVPPVVTPAAAPEVAKPAAKPAEKPTSPAKNEAEETAVSKSLQSWAAAWSRKDVKAYLTHYAPDFQPPGGLNRKAWEKERAARIDKPGKIQVTVDDIKVSISGDKATVHFRQGYKSASLKSSASKTLIFVRSGGKWMIQQERIG